jgi:hypothetical protein
MKSSKLDMDKLKLEFTTYSVQKPSIKRKKKRGFFPLDKHILRGKSRHSKHTQPLRTDPTTQSANHNTSDTVTNQDKKLSLSLYVNSQLPS